MCGYTDLILLNNRIVCSECGKVIDESDRGLDWRSTRDRLERGLKLVWPKEEK